MAKRSKRCHVRYERDQSGCMWGLISIFDFRHARSTQKLLSDRRRGSKHPVGAGNPRNNPDMSTNLDDGYQSKLDGEESEIVATDAGKPSVKKLIEEEMVNEHDTKEITNAEVEAKQSDSGYGGQKTKNLKKSSKTRSKSCERVDDLVASENLGSECPCLHNSEKQSANGLDIDNIMKELCHQIHQRSISCAKHDQHAEVQEQPNQENLDFKEKLSEAIKLFRSQRLINGKCGKEDGDIHPTKEVMGALEILSSNEELFLKFLQGPNSILEKYIPNLQNDPAAKDKDSNSQSNFEQEHGDLKPTDVVNRKQRSFFKRKAKSLDRNPSKENKTSQGANRIVILKPGSKVLQNPETGSSFGSIPESNYIPRNTGPNERFGSSFFLSEIKRKWKHAMGKEQLGVSVDGTSKRLPNKQQPLGGAEKGINENVGKLSPGKDHFFIERIVRPSAGAKKGDKTGKLKECEKDMKHGTADFSNQRVSNIYVEARKHLSEMLSNGDEDVAFSNRQVPKTLGRILSLPEYNFSPIGSPGRDWGHGFITAQMKFSASDRFQKQESNVSHLGQTDNLETLSSISDDNTDTKEQALDQTSNNLDKLSLDNEVEKANCSVGDEGTSEGDVEVLQVVEIVTPKDDSILDALSERSTSSITIDDQNGDTSEVCDEKAHPDHLKQGFDEECQPVSSPSLSPSDSSLTKKVEELESIVDMQERPSPVSVLEPLFTEEDISPASTRSKPVELPMQPMRIRFEEHDSSAADQGICRKTYMEGKESVFEYIKAVLQASGLNWDELCMWADSLDEILDPSLLDEVEFFSNQLCGEKKLLFDCINEVLGEVYGCYFGCSPWLSFAKPGVRPVPDLKNTTYEVWEGVCWHLLPLPLPHTLDQIIQKDMAKTRTWINLQSGTESIIVEMGEAIFEELMEETILSCINEGSENGSPLLIAELEEDKGSSIDL